MKKYYVWLSDNYTADKPLSVDWSVDLLPKEYYEEFKELMINKLREIMVQKKVPIVVDGMSWDEVRRRLLISKVLVGEEVRKFMMRKQINLVEDNRDVLKSVFLLKKGEKKVISERQKKALSAYEKVVKKLPDGTDGEAEGFLEFKEYAPKKSKEPVKVKNGWQCPKCNKFSSAKIAIISHMRTHARKV